MKKFRLIFILSVSAFFTLYSQEQVRTPEILNTGTLSEQLDYIQNRTSIYNNFRAIREDIFLGLKKNTLDTLSQLNKKIAEQLNEISNIQNQQDSLYKVLNKTNEDLEFAVKNRDNMKFLGISMNKTLYNAIVWLIITALAVLLVFTILLFLRNRSLMLNSQKELASVQEEFENYRRTSREKTEKLVMDHFNEIKRLKGER